MMKKKFVCLTAQEMKELILNNKDVPTSIFFGGRERDFVVKSRSIFGTSRKRNPVKIMKN